jgi:hypothetical protein
MEALSKEEVVRVIERKGEMKIPAVFCKWWGSGTYKKYGAALDELEREYPDDVLTLWHTVPGTIASTSKNPEYRWGFENDYSLYARHSIGQEVELLKDWKDFGRFLDSFPDPNEPGVFDNVERGIEKACGRYTLGCFWRLYHEMMWQIRGMENLMCDYFEDMDNLKVLGSRLLEYHKSIVDKYARIGVDGIFTSDDLGHQKNSMMSPAIFEELFLPLYKDLFSHIHSKGMHVWLHSCGNNTPLMDMLVESGLDVFHPVQKGCMDEEATAKIYGSKLSFLYGIDVQHILPEGTPEEVESEVKNAKIIFHADKGGLIFAAGNGIMPDTPLENIRVMLKTVYSFR